MMKLLSGHEIKEFTEEEMEKQKDFKAYTQLGLIRLQPGNWVFLKNFPLFADKIYNFQFRADDTLIMTYPKCGTTWVQEIVWTIVNNPDLDNPDANQSIHLRSPFLEFDFLSTNPYFNQFMEALTEMPLLKEFVELCPGQDPRNGMILQMAEALKGKRTLKTHNPLSLFDQKLLDMCKIVYVARNPKDVCVSFFHHSRIIKGHDFVGSMESFVDLFLNDALIWSPFWSHIKEFWNKRSHPNLHFIFYEDMIAKPEEQISLLAEFLEKPLSDNQLKNVVDHTSFNSMKARTEELGVLPKTFSNSEIIAKDGGFFRKGESGGWKSKLTPELEAKIDAWTKENTQDMESTFKYKL